MTDAVQSDKSIFGSTSFKNIPLDELKAIELPGPDDREDYGIKGMKWGVRRSQATLDRLAGRTPSKSSTSKVTATRTKRNKPSSSSAPKPKTPAKKKPSTDRQARRDREDAKDDRRTLSTEELRERVSRMKLERELSSLTTQDLTPGRAFVNSIASDAAKRTLTTAAAGLSLWAINAALDKSERNRVSAAKYLKPKK